MTKQQFRKIRGSFGLSMAEAARRCRVPYRTWQSWEGGEVPVPPYSLTLLEYLWLGQNTDKPFPIDLVYPRRDRGYTKSPNGD